MLPCCRFRRQHFLDKPSQTTERVEKLEGISFFPADKAETKEPQDDEMLAPRKNRSWEEYRLDLAIAYIQKGNYDTTSLDDVDLRRWAAEQRRQHKLYLTGKTTTLSFGQIQKLIDIKLVSKRPKHQSWTENCADLLAFRIQFGTFDVMNAHVVTNSKGRTVNTCNINTAALKEWVVKLREHYREPSKSIETSEELSQEQIAILDGVGFPWSGDFSEECKGDSAAKVAACMPSQEETVDAHEDTSTHTVTATAQIKSNIFGTALEMQQQTSDG